MSEEPKKEKRGGHRPGAGRKPKEPELGKKIAGTWALAPDVNEHILKQPNQPDYLERLVRADMKPNP